MINTNKTIVFISTYILFIFVMYSFVKDIQLLTRLDLARIGEVFRIDIALKKSKRVITLGARRKYFSLIR